MKRPLTLDERERVVAEARTWLGTPFHDCADVKGAGVDCGLLLVRIFVDLGFVAPFDPRPYAPQWFLHREEEKFLKWVASYCDPVEADAAQPGDILVYRFGRCASHGALVIDGDLMIHAYKAAGCVELRERRAPLVHGTLDSAWSPRIEA